MFMLVPWKCEFEFAVVFELSFICLIEWFYKLWTKTITLDYFFTDCAFSLLAWTARGKAKIRPTLDCKVTVGIAFRK